MIQCSSGQQNLEQKLEGIIKQIKIDVSEKESKEEKDLFEKAREPYKDGEFDKLMKRYNDIIDLELKNCKYWNNKGIDLEKLGKHKEANECYRKVLDINPEYSPTWNNMGYLFSKLGDKKSALKCYDAALKLNPENETYKKNKEITKENIKSNSKIRKAKNKLTDIVSRSSDKLLYTTSKIGGTLKDLISKAYKPILKTTFGAGIAGGLAYGVYKGNKYIFDLAEDMTNNTGFFDISFTNAINQIDTMLNLTLLNGAIGGMASIGIGTSLGLLGAWGIGDDLPYEFGDSFIGRASRITLFSAIGSAIGTFIDPGAGTLIGSYLGAPACYGLMQLGE